MKRKSAGAPPPTSSRAKSARATRPVPVLTNDESAFLTAITESGNFTLEKVLRRHDRIPPSKKA